MFYTNYASEKSKALANTPQCCLSFHWEAAERQVIIKGVADKIDPSDSDAYFLSRPKGSQLGAWASKQSTVIENRAVLDTQLESLPIEIAENQWWESAACAESLNYTLNVSSCPWPLHRPPPHEVSPPQEAGHPASQVSGSESQCPAAAVATVSHGMPQRASTTCGTKRSSSGYSFLLLACW